jgi:hypothetical protein
MPPNVIKMIFDADIDAINRPDRPFPSSNQQEQPGDLRHVVSAASL